MSRLIDADALFNWSGHKLSDAVKYGNKDSAQQSWSYSTLMMYEIADEIDDAPTIEPKRGEWIGYSSNSYNGIDDCGEPKWIPKKFFRCSECRKGTAIQSNFCPNCGCCMKEEAQNE